MVGWNALCLFETFPRVSQTYSLVVSNLGIPHLWPGNLTTAPRATDVATVAMARDCHAYYGHYWLLPQHLELRKLMLNHTINRYQG